MGSVPGPARDLVRAITQAVDSAAEAADARGYDSAVARLVGHPEAGRVLGDVLRALLEDTHPDGLASDDITLVIGRCYSAATTWLPGERVDATMLLRILAGALGIHEAVSANPVPDPGGTDTGGAPGWPDLAWHALLLVADLLPYAPANLDEYVRGAFDEYAREAREESP